MLRWLFVLLICYLITLATQAQINLVPNPSFEEYTDCPFGVPDLEGKCNYWTSFRGSPDYFNNCSSNVGYENPFGYQVAHSGQAYTGISNYLGTIYNCREQIGVELSGQLEIGVRYYVSFHISSAYTPLLVNIASNKIGALFTTYQYSDPNLNLPLPNNCQVFSNVVITDTVNWVKISGSFVADSAYKYLVIGGFFDDAQLDTIHFPYQVVPQVSYYYLDDVCVSTDSIYTETWTSTRGIGQALYDITVFPNPSQGLIHIESQIAIKSIKVSNTNGDVLLQMQTEQKQYQLLDLTSFPNGIYFSTIELQSGYRAHKKIVIDY